MQKTVRMKTERLEEKNSPHKPERKELEIRKECNLKAIRKQNEVLGCPKSANHNNKMVIVCQNLLMVIFFFFFINSIYCL